ncbi:hypothetical protein D8I30_09530 [Brevundimonas naejangsanensis]|uniref:PEGA domain-containing protein n=1 Tax=Brevundimonas naejangsanensis TaxID=588932 RepID=A0A494RJ00_9CAUL|nr:hypothetical protein [Brevundimonas naejangsanensis]AYG95389.1 hypothetical protein D8I30_09530 [Brevundimonas naejangsanensis]
MRALIFAAVIGLSVAGCATAYPTSTVSQGTPDGRLWFSGAPAGARVVIDGVDAGEAAAFDGRAAILEVTPGRHVVEVVAAGTPIHSQTVMVGAGSRIQIKVR